MYRFLSLVLIILLVLTPWKTAHADVSLRNGNFFVSFRDISYTGGFGMKIERIYNSKSDFKGMFGYGWGIEYETALHVAGDGSIVIAEFGGGANNVFLPEHQSDAAVQKEIDQIVAAVQKRGDITGADKLKAYRSTLSYAETRMQAFEKYRKLGLLEAVKLPVGARLVSDQFESQEIRVLRDGFRRTQPESGIVQFFDQSGRLRELVNYRGNFLLFNYDIPHQITMRDDIGDSMVLLLDERGLVTRIDGSGGKSAIFRYDHNGMLIYCRDDGGIENTFAYTDDNYLNLNKIGYPNDHNKSMDITYYPPEVNSSVKSVTNPDGTRDDYEYVLGDKMYYKVIVKISSAPDAAGKRTLTKESAYEYISAIGENTMQITATMIVTENGKKTTNTYTEFGYPLRKEGPDGVVEFAYDSQHRQISRKGPHMLVETGYDPASGRINQLTYTPIPSGKKTDFRFTYDEKGLLTTAARDSLLLDLRRDSLGRISEIESQDGEILDISFDAGDAPESVAAARRVANAGLSKPEVLAVTYAGGGKIGQVESKQGDLATKRIAGELADWLAIVNASIVGCDAYDELDPPVPVPPSSVAKVSNEKLLSGALETLAQVR